MSKKLEVTSCSECPNATYSMANMGTMCEILPINKRMIDTDEIGDSGTKIWSKCPLAEYEQSVVRWAEKPVISRRTITNAFGLKDGSPLREEYENHVSVPETVAPAPVEMMNLMVLIESSYAYDTYYAPDGNVYHNHPSKVNEFMQRVNTSGGDIIFVKDLSGDEGYLIHYSVPVGTYPINI